MKQRRHIPATVLASVVALSLAQPTSAQSNATALRDLSGHHVNEAQLRSAVASRTLTWLTGTSANNDYMSVGRMANFFGFVALRVSSGQSLTRAHVARDTLAVLEPNQIDILVTLLDAQTAPHAATQAARIEMNRALERLLVGEDIAQAEFLALGRTYGAAEAELGRVIAQHFGDLAATLTPEQTERLATIRAAHATGQPDLVPSTRGRAQLPDVDRQELVNLAARFLSWTTGSPELNDFEVVGKPSQHFGFVSLRLDSGHAVRRGAVAREVLDLLTQDQQGMLDVAVRHNTKAFPDFLTVRANLMRALEVALQGEAIDRAATERLGSKVGEIEASMTWAQAEAMLNVRDAMSSDQLDALLDMRAKYMVTEQDGTARDAVDFGRQLFAQCVLCHAPSRDNAVAPSLNGIIGRKIAADASYDHYSPALQRLAQSEGTWTVDLLDTFLQSPRSLVPGTTMGFDGLGSGRDRAALIDYLTTLN
ncbi:MAG: hypothetical protein AAFQ79_05350 [Pseudomonadota bacterium]